MSRGVPDLAGKVCVVTGAAAGIGRALALELSARGAALALVDVDRVALDAVASALGPGGGAVSTHVADVSDRGRMLALPAEVLRAHGAVHVLVNNAGIAIAGELVDQDLADWDRIVAINLFGVVHGCKAFVPLLQDAGEGHVVNMSSMLGLVAFPGQSAYAATKFAVKALSDALRAELARSGVGVTCVHPGAVRTDILKKARFTDEGDRETFTRVMEAVAIPPEHVARRVVRAIERGTDTVVIGPDARVVAGLGRSAPSLTRWALGRLMALRGRPGSG